MRKESWESCRLHCLRANDDNENVCENVSSLMRWRMLGVIKTVILFPPSSLLLQMKSHDDGHCPVTFIIEKWKWMKNISLCFVSEWKVLTAATFKLSHFTMYSVSAFLEAQTHGSPSGHIWSHENIHHLLLAMVSDTRGIVWCQGRLMDGLDIKLGILRERERVTRALRGQEILLFKSMECF